MNQSSRSRSYDPSSKFRYLVDSIGWIVCARGVKNTNTDGFALKSAVMRKKAVAGDCTARIGRRCSRRRMVLGQLLCLACSVHPMDRQCV